MPWETQKNPPKKSGATGSTVLVFRFPSAQHAVPNHARQELRVAAPRVAARGAKLLQGAETTSDPSELWFFLRGYKIYHKKWYYNTITIVIHGVFQFCFLGMNHGMTQKSWAVTKKILLSFHWILVGLVRDSPFLDYHNPQWLLGSIIPQLTINQQGVWTLLRCKPWFMVKLRVLYEFIFYQHHLQTVIHGS